MTGLSIEKYKELYKELQPLLAQIFKISLNDNGSWKGQSVELGCLLNI